MGRNFTSVDEYIQSCPEDVQPTLQEIRRTIREAVPEAEEVISYQIPAYRYHGFLVYFWAARNHYSLSCPPPSEAFEVFAEQLAPYKLTKSAINFPKDKPLPLDLIREIVRFRARENLEKEATKPKSRSRAKQSDKANST